MTRDMFWLKFVVLSFKYCIQTVNQPAKAVIQCNEPYVMKLSAIEWQNFIN